MREIAKEPPQANGLTLIEVALALAIAASVLTILAGALGTTVQYAADGFDRFAMARISQSFSDENRMLDWDRLDTEIEEGKMLYFDERGKRLESKTTEAVYVARLTLVDGPPLPGTSTGSPHLRRLLIEVSSRGRAEDPFSGANPVYRFSSLYTRMEAIRSTPAE